MDFIYLITEGDCCWGVGSFYFLIIWTVGSISLDVLLAILRDRADGTITSYMSAATFRFLSD